MRSYSILRKHLFFFSLLMALALLLCPANGDDVRPRVLIKPSFSSSGNITSNAMAIQGWKALEKKEYKKAIKYVNKCIKRFSRSAKRQQASLDGFADESKAFSHWALNDVATSLYIKGMALRGMQKDDKAQEIFQKIIDQYSFAQCWDARGWFWKVAQAAKTEIDSIEAGVDFGDVSSQALTAQAWESLKRGENVKARVLADKCIELYSEKASLMQLSLKDFVKKGEEFEYWALNDVATCTFIKGKSFREQKNEKEAEKAFQEIIDRYAYSQCWDARGWFWKPAMAARSEKEAIQHQVDFSDYSSETLTSKAWEALEMRKFKEAEIYVRKCLEFYEKNALAMQVSLKDFADDGKEFDYWALNDVATSLFILGRAYYLQGYEEKSKKIHNIIIDKFSYAQSWDPQGWFWRVAEASHDQLLLMDTGIDFGDYTSETLTVKAWEALEEGDSEAALIYTNKCISLYKQHADKMQNTVDFFVPKKAAFNYWALNDVGTCYFIIGEAYMRLREYEKARAAYQLVVDKYFFSQCWDPRGWFWKPAVAARGKINKIATEQGVVPQSTSVF